MTFDIRLGPKVYEVEPVGFPRISFRVKDCDIVYNIKLNADGDWICDCSKPGGYPIPVEEIGSAIQDFYSHSSHS